MKLIPDDVITVAYRWHLPCNSLWNGENNMSYVITAPCVGTCDTVCVDACPVDCIQGPLPIEELRSASTEKRASQFSTFQLFINPDECICCGGCEPECPVDAIYEEDSVPAKHAEDIARNARFFLEQPLA